MPANRRHRSTGESLAVMSAARDTHWPGVTGVESEDTAHELDDGITRIRPESAEIVACSAVQPVTPLPNAPLSRRFVRVISVVPFPESVRGDPGPRRR